MLGGGVHPAPTSGAVKQPSECRSARSPNSRGRLSLNLTRGPATKHQKGKSGKGSPRLKKKRKVEGKGVDVPTSKIVGAICITANFIFEDPCAYPVPAPTHEATLEWVSFSVFSWSGCAQRSTLTNDETSNPSEIITGDPAHWRYLIVVPTSYAISKSSD